MGMGARLGQPQAEFTVSRLPIPPPDADRQKAFVNYGVSLTFTPN
jgi:hypothetical protein